MKPTFSNIEGKTKKFMDHNLSLLLLSKFSPIVLRKLCSSIFPEVKFLLSSARDDLIRLFNPEDRLLARLLSMGIELLRCAALGRRSFFIDFTDEF